MSIEPGSHHNSSSEHALETFGNVEPSQFVFAAFKPAGRFQGKSHTT
jgi:hypothetical protein